MGPGKAVAGVAAVAIVGAVGIGCGGSSGTTATQAQTQTVTTQQQGSAPTKAAYIKEVDAICTKYRTQGQQLQREIQTLGQPQSLAELHRLASLYRNAADLVSQEFQQIRQVRPPTGDQSIVDNWTSTIDTGISILRDFADAVDNAKGTNDSQLRTLAKEVTSNTDKASGIAQGYGFKVCGSDTG
jgi:hypothetical protein